MGQTSYLFAPDELKARGCTRCTLRGSTIVENVVVPNSPLMLIGEAPGQQETEEEIPFIGPAGQELDRHLRYCRIPREKVSIGNVVRCQPKSGRTNREPTKIELQCCSLYLEEFIEAAKPKVIVALGNTAVTSLLGPQKVGISKLRGRIFWYRDQPIYVITTWHPSFLLRDQKTYMTQLAVEEFRQDLITAKRLCIEPFEDHKKNVLIVNDEKRALIALASIAKQRATCIDVEGHRPDRLYTTAFSTKDGKGAVVLPIFHKESKLVKDGVILPSIFKAIQKILKSKKIEIFGQNFNDLDRALLENVFQCEVNGVVRDTMYGSYIDDERKRVHSLGLIAARYARMGNYDWPLYQWIEKQGMTHSEAMSRVGDIPLDVLGPYNGLDVIATHLSMNAMWDRFNLASKRLTKVLTEASRVTQEMEDTGIAFDAVYSAKLSRWYDGQLRELSDKIRGMVGDREFNPASPEQVSKYVFEELKLHETVEFTPRENKLLKTPTGEFSTKEEILLRIAEDTEDPYGQEFLEAELEFRDKSKDQGTFTDGMRDRMSSDGRIHVPIILHGSATGRAACTLHNVKKTFAEFEGKERYVLLDQFVASPGYKLVRGDYKQIELRMAAEISQDEVFLDVFHRGLDPHYETAAFLFQLPEGVKETMEQRTIGKNGNFGSLFGLNENELFEYMQTKIRGFSVPREDVIAFHRSFYERHKRFKEWQEETIQFARKYGYVEGLFGRRRTLNPDQGRHFANQAVNTPIQGSAHDLLLIAMIQLYQLPNRDFRILLDHHDALWFEVPEKTLYPDLRRIKESMEHLDTKKWYAKELTIPTPIDLEVGERMGRMKEVQLED